MNFFGVGLTKIEDKYGIMQPPYHISLKHFLSSTAIDASFQPLSAFISSFSYKITPYPIYPLRIHKIHSKLLPEPPNRRNKERQTSYLSADKHASRETPAPPNMQRNILYPSYQHAIAGIGIKNPLFKQCSILGRDAASPP